MIGCEAHIPWTFLNSSHNAVNFLWHASTLIKPFWSMAFSFAGGMFLINRSQNQWLSSSILHHRVSSMLFSPRFHLVAFLSICFETLGYRIASIARNFKHVSRMEIGFQILWPFWSFSQSSSSIHMASCLHHRWQLYLLYHNTGHHRVTSQKRCLNSIIINVFPRQKQVICFEYHHQEVCTGMSLVMQQDEPCA